MTCMEAMERLDDYVDGLLADNEASALREHLDACIVCCESEAELRNLLRDSEALPRTRTPSRELWPGIVASIAPRPAAAPHRNWLAIPAVATVVVMLVSAIALNQWRSGTSPEVSKEHGVEKQSNESLLLECAQTRDALLADLEQRKDSLSPETLAIVRKNLVQIDAAIKEIETALATDPRSGRLQTMLVSTYEKEFGFLAQILRLSDSA